MKGSLRCTMGIILFVILIEAMEAGEFYASKGVELKELNLINQKFSIEVEQEEGISYQISFIGCKKE